MRKIVIASGNRQAAQRVKNMLAVHGIQMERLFSSGAEVLSYAVIRPEAVIICGRLPDMTAVTLAEMVPAGFDIISLTPSGQSQMIFRSNLISLNMPLNTRELVSTVKTLAVTQNQSYQRKNHRPDDEEKLITHAKQRIMERHHISESQAHKILQKRSMDSGVSMLQVASLVLEEYE
ncbi:MAG: ANTAR domain-containing protein [Oscillospiraceae bacterium]|nr:ANTAR domain-containing protein [Oscillospiraceae bacterium]